MLAGHFYGVRESDQISFKMLLQSMETQENRLLLLVTGAVAILLTSMIVWLVKRYYKQQIFKRYGIPGPKPHLITGNMTDLLSAATPNEVISGWIKKYGNVFGFFIGAYPRLVVNDVEYIKDIFVKEFRKFPNREPLILRTFTLLHTVLYLRDERWKEVRSILTPTFSSSKIRQMTDVMNTKVDKMLQVIEGHSSKDQSFDMHLYVQALTLDVIGECALALKVNCQQDPEDPLLVAVRDFFKYCNGPAVRGALYFPPLKFLMEFIANYLTAGRMTSLTIDNVTKVIAHRRAQKGSKAIDLLQLMLDSSEEQGTTGNKSRLLTDDEIIANAYIFLLAGYETTATALAFTFYLLAKHQAIQQRLYEEIFEQIGGKKHPSYDDIANMQYLDQVFSESLRYYPPVTSFICRECKEEYKINGFTIPKGVVVQAPIWDIHHNPDLWPDPWTFDPDRFSPEKKIAHQQCSFFPFGLGPRNCIGMRFAKIEAKLAIARTVLTYNLVFCDETNDPLDLVCPTVIINPKYGVFLKAIKR